MALTEKKIAQLTEHGRFGDGHGLYLQVISPTNRSWLLRYQTNGRKRWMGLGALHVFTLKQARERARAARQQLADGIDPLEARRQDRAKTVASNAATVTFKECAEQYDKFHAPKWGNAKHAAQFLSTLKTYAYPVMDRLPVAAIDKALVLQAIEPIWYAKTETASRVRGRIEAVLDFAKVRGYRDGDNPAAWTGNLIHALPARATIAKVVHHPALPFDRLPDFMMELADREGIAARALEFIVLSASRTGEVIGARWDEIDLDGKLWTVPAARMKAKREHRVPLTGPALKILKALPREGQFVFVGSSKGAPLSNMAMAQVLKRMGRGGITVHGFRSTFRDWAAERTSYANHVVERALAHAVSDKVEAAYRRGDLFAKRARLMADWAKFATRPAATISNVTPIRGRA